MRLQVPSLALLSGLRIRPCRELWCRSQTQLRSGVAVALAWAGGCSSNWTPGLGSSTCRGIGPRKGKKTKKKKDLYETTYRRKLQYSVRFFFGLFDFLGLHPRHMEVPRLGVQLELLSPAHARATATPDPSRVFDLHHSSRQRWILSPLSEARD